MHGRSWTEFYILITNCPNIATSLANIATSFVGMKDVAMLAKDVAMLGRTLLHVKSLIATEKLLFECSILEKVHDKDPMVLAVKEQYWIRRYNVKHKGINKNQS